jgi:hypothetical protein
MTGSVGYGNQVHCGGFSHGQNLGNRNRSCESVCYTKRPMEGCKRIGQMFDGCAGTVDVGQGQQKINNMKTRDEPRKQENNKLNSSTSYCVTKNKKKTVGYTNVQIYLIQCQWAHIFNCQKARITNKSNLFTQVNLLLKTQ